MNPYFTLKIGLSLVAERMSLIVKRATTSKFKRIDGWMGGAREDVSFGKLYVCIIITLFYSGVQMPVLPGYCHGHDSDF